MDKDKGQLTTSPDANSQDLSNQDIRQIKDEVNQYSHKEDIFSSQPDGPYGKRKKKKDLRQNFEEKKMEEDDFAEIIEINITKMKLEIIKNRKERTKIFETQNPKEIKMALLKQVEEPWKYIQTLGDQIILLSKMVNENCNFVKALEKVVMSQIKKNDDRLEEIKSQTNKLIKKFKKHETLKQEIDDLKKEIDKENEFCLNQTAEIKLLVSKADCFLKQAKENQRSSLGDFPIQVFKALADFLKLEEFRTVEQCKYIIEGMNPVAREKLLEFLELQTPEKINDFYQSVGALKDLIIDLPHHAISCKINSSIEELRNLSQKHDISDAFDNVLKVWNKLVESGLVFIPETWKIRANEITNTNQH